MGDSVAAMAELKQPPVVLNSFRVDPRVHLNRAHAAVYSCAILALLYHHALSLFRSPSFLSFSLALALTLADLTFAFMWVLTQPFRWRPVRREEFPDRLAEAVDREDWPGLDVFVCTADPHKEPPMGLVNTVLSTMAFDYPAGKLSVYVSDDGGSQLTLFALTEAARFAGSWLPFCRERCLVDRCPDAYFRTGGGSCSEDIMVRKIATAENISDDTHITAYSFFGVVWGGARGVFVFIHSLLGIHLFKRFQFLMSKVLALSPSCLHLGVTW